MFCFLRRSFCNPRLSFFSVLDCSKMGKWQRTLFWFQHLPTQSLVKSNSKSQYLLDSVTSPKTSGHCFCVAESVCETVIAQKVLSRWNCLLHFGMCCIFPKGNGSEYNKTCCHEKKTGKPRKTWKQRKFRGQKTAARAGKGWKGRENCGKERTLKIEVQILPETCPKGLITDFDSPSFLSCQILLKAAIQVTQYRCKPTLDTCNYENIYACIYCTVWLVFCLMFFLQCLLHRESMGNP